MLKLSLALTSLAGSALAQTTWHVAASAPSGGNGQSWATAFDALPDAIAAAGSNDQIWVAAGVYRPGPSQTSDPRATNFKLPPDLALYGGFSGSETSLAQRAGLFDTTVLSGDIGVIGNPSDNAYHVVETYGVVVLDGFRITGGDAVGALDSVGGGIYCTTGQSPTNPQLYMGSALTLRNSRVSGNRAVRGGGLFAQLANLKVSHCVFENNESTGFGGALYLQTTVARFDLCQLRRNRTESFGGAGYFTSIPTAAGRPRVQFFGSLFHDNSAVDSGGAICLASSNLTAGHGAFTNCTFALNSAGVAGGAIWANTTTTNPARSYLENSIVWANRAPISAELHGTQFVWNSIAPGQTGTNIVTGAPRFVGLTQRNFRLKPNSPAIDAGSDALVLPDILDVDGDGSQFELVPIDLDGFFRIFGARVDLGAFEH